MVLTKEELIGSLKHEVHILLHLASKVDKAKADYRPTPKQRSILELMQFLAPGRHARLEDFLVDAGTACLGFAIAALADWVVTRLRANSAVTS